MTSLRQATNLKMPRPEPYSCLCGTAVALVTCLATTTAAAEPEDTKAQCLNAYEEGQRAQRRGALSEAQEAFTYCGGASCPEALHADCQRWLEEVEAATPTSVFRVRAPSGKALQGVEVRIDDGPTRKLDGRALAFDPGEHSLSFELEGYQPYREVFTFSEGEKLVVREVRLQLLASKTSDGQVTTSTLSEAEPLSAIDQNSQGTLVPAWVGLGVGALGAAGFAYFGYSARADDRALNECSPNCAQTRVDEVRDQYLAANVSLGVGVAGLLGAAAWLLFGSSDAEASVASTASDFELRVGPMTSLVRRF